MLRVIGQRLGRGQHRAAALLEVLAASRTRGPSMSYVSLLSEIICLPNSGSFMSSGISRNLSTQLDDLLGLALRVQRVEQQVGRVDRQLVLRVLPHDVLEQLRGLVEVVVLVVDARLAVLDGHQLGRVGHVLDVGVEGPDHLLLVLGDLHRLELLAARLRAASASPVRLDLVLVLVVVDVERVLPGEDRRVGGVLDVLAASGSSRRPSCTARPRPSSSPASTGARRSRSAIS